MPIHLVLTDERVPVKVWTTREDLQAQAETQLRNVARLPCVYRHVAAMPDVHPGEGSTIGSVIATTGAVMPSTVEVDIACGVRAVRLPLPADQVEVHAPALLDGLRAAIPVGRHIHARPVAEAETWEGWHTFTRVIPAVQASRDKYLRGLQTLGGGNHFLELCRDLDGQTWIVVHSGSRNLGKRLAELHIETAKGLMRQYFIELPDPSLAYLVEGTPEFDQYWHDLQWAQAYAAYNRELMLRRAIRVVQEILGLPDPPQPTTQINCHHNYVAREHHFGRNVFVTRKGAVRARQGDLGLIPGSMGAQTYVVRGRGNPESFQSCSHGAGRIMSRRQAIERFRVEDLVAQTEGVTCLKDAEVLDEIPAAYRPIDQVMANQTDLVEVVTILKQFVCLKGPKNG